MQRSHRELVREQAKRAKPFSLEELDARFQALFARLVDEGVVERRPDAPPIVSKEQWLKAPEVAIGSTG